MRALGWAQTMVIFGAAGMLLLLCTHLVVPYLIESRGIEPLLSWFVAGGLGVFFPLMLFAVWLLSRESRVQGKADAPGTRLRFRKMNIGDWAWSVGAFVVIALLTVALQLLLRELVPDGASMQPAFMEVEPLAPARYWLLGAWLPFWVFNIMGEELLWRGVILPRQELALGRHAWLANALGWLLFHAAFGWKMMVVLIPIVFILPFVTQLRQNSWVAVILHAGLNGPGFLAVVLGFI